MIIQKIRMINFGPFYGEHEIAFPGDGMGVHIIRGNNGQGKTSILRAILWTLYGKVTDRKGIDIRPTSLLNRTAFKEDLYQFGVTIYFSHEDEDWIITRKMEAHTHSDAKYRDGKKIELVKNGETVPNPEHEINRMIPCDVSRFFFFDGEMLRDYEELLDQNSSSRSKLQESIEQVLGIPYLKTARNDLYEVQKKFENDYGRNIRRLGGKAYESYVDDYNAIRLEIDDRNGEIKKIEDDIAQLDTQISEKKRNLVDLKSVHEDATKRLLIDGKIKELESKRDVVNSDIRKFASQYYKTVLKNIALNIMLNLKKKHEESMGKYERKQRLISHVEDLERAIKDQKCKLCGTILNESALRQFESELKDTRITIESLTEIPQPNLEYRDHIDRLTIMMEQTTERDIFDKKEAEKNRIEYQIASEKSQLKDVEERLKGIDEEEPRRLEIEIQNMREEKGRLVGLKQSEDKKLLDDMEVKRELEQRLASIDQKELKILHNRIEVAKAIAEVIENAISTYRNDRRSDVGSKASEFFKELRTKESFSKLEINEQFGLNIITSDGTVLDRPEWRSSGEEQIVALALIAALNKCAHVKAPVFMDTPFGRLDTKHGKRVLTFLPRLADQVVLLVTDRELRKGDEKFLEGKIKSDNTVIHQGEKEGSDIMRTGVAG